MSKTVTINQDKLLKLKESMASDSNISSHNNYCSELTEARPEKDVFKIGPEEDSVFTKHGYDERQYLYVDGIRKRTHLRL